MCVCARVCDAPAASGCMAVLHSFSAEGIGEPSPKTELGSGTETVHSSASSSSSPSPRRKHPSSSRRIDGQPREPTADHVDSMVCNRGISLDRLIASALLHPKLRPFPESWTNSFQAIPGIFTIVSSSSITGFPKWKSNELNRVTAPLRPRQTNPRRDEVSAWPKVGFARRSHVNRRGEHRLVGRLTREHLTFSRPIPHTPAPVARIRLDIFPHDETKIADPAGASTRRVSVREVTQSCPYYASTCFRCVAVHERVTRRAKNVSLATGSGVKFWSFSLWIFSCLHVIV